MTDSTDVDTTAVLEFAAALEVEATAGAVLPVEMQLANLGASGMQEGVWAAGTYAAALDAVTQFSADALDGLRSLAWVSVTVAENYAFGDAEQAASMAGVDAAFAPAPGQPSLATQRAEIEAAAAAAAATDAAAAARRAEFFALSGETPPGQEPATAAAGATGPPATGASTVGDGPESTQYGRYAAEVRTHRTFVANGQHGATAEDDYHPRDDYDAAVEEARRRSGTDRIPYVVQVDDHGRSEVVQADPDDIPYVAPVTSTPTTAAPLPRPGVVDYGG